MVETYLLNHGWIAVVAFILLYIGDYYLTLAGANQAKAVQKNVAIEGSYEMTPSYQKDVDNARKFSPRLLYNLILGSLMLTAWYWISYELDSATFYGVMVGAFVFVQAIVYKQHIENILRYSALKRMEGRLIGQIKYPREYIVYATALEWYGMAAFTLVASLIASSPILLGCALRCAGFAIQITNNHNRNMAAQPKSDA